MTTDRPRLSIDLEPGQKEKLKKLLPWGVQRRIISEVINLLIEFITTNGLGVGMDALLNGRAKIIINGSTHGND